MSEIWVTAGYLSAPCSADEAVFEPGHLLFFREGKVHGLPDILDGPVVFLSVDTPRRDPKDMFFVNRDDGSLETFIRGR